ncbi:MAG: lipoprotein-releasing ABC transporter permease subunit [Candidatus Euphemobacter frigidus]|nr:lipoprotein-releasing ABC transporter permease subunit [Candidatus Euphemobacter frigidus]MDP8275813.1 lipoprotein-releasing ABC transporter permease subunit [Candidatus Euphemobacter frigidus]
MLPFTFWVGLRFLRFKGKESFVSLITVISIAGVAVGVMTLMVVMSVMSGFDRELKDKFLGIYGNVVVTSGGLIYNYPARIETIKTVPRVEAVAPFVTGQVIIRTRNRALGVNLRGIDPSAEARVSKLGKYIKEGTLQPGDKGIIIGVQFARICRLRPGDKVIVISPGEGLLPGAAGSRREKFTVTGIFKSGMAQYDLELAYIGLPAAQKLFNLGDGVNGLSIKLDDVEYAHAARNQIAELLPPPRYHVRSWMELNKPLFAAIQVEKNLMFIIVMLITVVASLNIASTLIVAVKEKTKAIGIFKSLGVTEATIRKMFTLQGVLIGMAGTIIGCGAGLLLIDQINHVADFISAHFGIKVFPPDVYYFESIPARINLGETAIIAACALFISILASLYPAWRAARMEPVEALRYE